MIEENASAAVLPSISIESMTGAASGSGSDSIVKSSTDTPDASEPNVKSIPSHPASLDPSGSDGCRASIAPSGGSLEMIASAAPSCVNTLLPVQCPMNMSRSPSPSMSKRPTSEVPFGVQACCTGYPSDRNGATPLLK